MYSGKHSAFMIIWKKSQQTFQFCKLRDCLAHVDKPMAEPSMSNSQLVGHAFRFLTLWSSSTNEAFYFSVST